MLFFSNKFIREFRDCKNEEELYAVLLKFTFEIGFRQFALGHHVDLLRPPRNAIRLTNYDTDWIGESLEKGYFSDDPIHAASFKAVHGFLWHEIGEYIEVTARQRLILDLAVKHGLGAGFTVPVHLPGEYAGTCSFGAPSLDRLQDDALPLAQAGALFAFESARRMMLRRDGLIAKVPDLSPRSRDALILVGRGKKDPEIAEILGVSKWTAHDHVEAARRAYGYAQRPFMIARALFDGIISFGDLLNR